MLFKVFLITILFFISSLISFLIAFFVLNFIELINKIFLKLKSNKILNNAKIFINNFFNNMEIFISNFLVALFPLIALGLIIWSIYSGGWLAIIAILLIILILK